MIKDEVNQLFEEQLSEWATAKDNYRALAQVEAKTLNVHGFPYQVQYNPMRLASVTAQCHAGSTHVRPCFLCAANRSPEQRGVSFKDSYTVLVNPYPIFPRHFTILSNVHTPQRIASRFGDMLDLAQQLDDDVVFYNGAKSGASIPDHFHFQAGNKGFLPIEKERGLPNAIRVESGNKEEMLTLFGQIYNSLPLSLEEVEPMMNILTWYENEQWTTYVFPRKKQRPACFWDDGEAHILVSPASVEMGGVLITPLRKDFEKITAAMIVDILNEVCLKKIDI